MGFQKTIAILAACVGLLGGCASMNRMVPSMPAPEEPPPAQLALVSTLGNGPPDWRTGDTWTYSDGYKTKVASVANDGLATLKRLDHPGFWTKRKLLFKQASKSSESVTRKVIFRSTDPAQLFPLALGKTVKYTREYMADVGDKEYLRVHETSWTVEGQETIEVPAGTFETWVLVWRSKSLKSDWTGYERWWYNPAIKHYVRMEYRYGKAPAGSRVLTRYKVCGAAGDPCEEMGAKVVQDVAVQVQQQ